MDIYRPTSLSFAANIISYAIPYIGPTAQADIFLRSRAQLNTRAQVIDVHKLKHTGHAIQ